jgi:hypothetical protein
VPLLPYHKSILLIKSTGWDKIKAREALHFSLKNCNFAQNNSKEDMKFGVVVFPGSNCDDDTVGVIQSLCYEADKLWHK